MYMEYIFSEEIKNETSKLLKSIGVKHGLKKLDHREQVEKKVEIYHVFKTSLEILEKESVNLLQSNIPVEVPVFVIDSCEFIKQNVRVEGLFRKAGSTSKQRELRALLDCGNRLELDSEHHVINVANILKLFFRELPEPLIPFKFHDLLLRGLVLKENKMQAVLLTCLLFPSDHLNTLAYLMQFLQYVAMHCDFNKMDIGNLSIIFTPTIMPVSAPKLTLHGGERINHHVQVVRLLIENAGMIGVVPESICEKLGLNHVTSMYETEDMEIKKRRKKKRSGSLTRMISGLKKIINKHSADDLSSSSPSECNIHTPKIISAKKRKAETLTLSSKKKREVLKSLPQGLTLANTLYTPHKYKSSAMLSPRILVTQTSRKSTSPLKVKKKCSSLKLQCAEMCTKDLKNSKCLSPANEDIIVNKTKGKKIISSAGAVDNYNCIQSPIGSPWNSNCRNSGRSEFVLEEEYVRIPKTEFEAIKDRVSQIESRIDNELENILGVSISDYKKLNNTSNNSQDDDCVNNIQCAYAKTMEHSERLNNSSTEQLTRKLSKELKIRRSSEQRIIRSPSARKIGTIRRRSKDNLMPRKELNRHLSLNSCDRMPNSNKNTLYSTRSLRRGRPNTIFSGLPHPNPLLSNYESVNVETGSCENSPSFMYGNSVNARKNKLICKSSSFNGRVYIEETLPKRAVDQQHSSSSLDSEWSSAKEYFNNRNMEELNEGNVRESIAKLRRHNVGMVLAKAKLFDSLNIKEKSQDNSSPINDNIQTSSSNNLPLNNKNNNGSFNNSKHCCVPESKMARTELCLKNRNIRNDKKCTSFKKNELPYKVGKENYGKIMADNYTSITSTPTNVRSQISDNPLSPLKDCNRLTPIIHCNKSAQHCKSPTKQFSKVNIEPKNLNTPVSVFVSIPHRSSSLIPLKHKH